MNINDTTICIGSYAICTTFPFFNFPFQKPYPHTGIQYVWFFLSIGSIKKHHQSKFAVLKDCFASISLYIDLIFLNWSIPLIAWAGFKLARWFRCIYFSFNYKKSYSYLWCFVSLWWRVVVWMRRPVETSGCRRPPTRTTVQATPMWSPPAPTPVTSVARLIPVTAGYYQKTAHCTPKPDTASDVEINFIYIL